jgi:hypothetical protein
MYNTLRRWFFLALVTSFVAAITTSIPAGSALDRESLDTLFARYDREPDGSEKDRLAAQIDALSHQRYATVSRLYWHVDLASARAAAREQGRPILHLRMLGRLDEDLSCANSRLFRATLYANRQVSQLLRERFVLYWSSERPVPRVTIDYGDGRRLERTITGNSAHYVLDEDGEVLDVLPGLYAPAQFRLELERSLALAAQVRHQAGRERARLVADHHQQHVSAAERDWDRLATVTGLRDLSQRLTQPREETEFVAAQRMAISKSGIELRRIRSTARELAPETAVDDQMRLWALAGERLYRTAAPVLDDPSRALVARLHNAGSRELDSTAEELDGMIARLEQTIVADTALNQLQLRPQIAREIVRRGGRVEFTALNIWIYDQVFRTPRQDPWLGLLQRDVFTGLPGDGVVWRSGKR